MSIPVVDGSGKVVKKGLYRKTLADQILPEFDNDLSFLVKYPNSEEPKEMPVWRFIEKFLRITDKNGKFVPFALTKPQIELYKSLCLQKRVRKPMRVNILKARQLGFSTVIAAIIFTLTAFKPNQKACIIADKEENARNLFDKYITFYEALPTWFKQTLVKQKNNARELRFAYGDGQFSLIRILVQGEDSGRSYSFQYIHASECAAWKDLKKSLVSLLNTVSETNIDSLVVLETTAKGCNDYKERWDKDCSGSGTSQYQALFFPWFENPEYKLPYGGFALYDWEKDLKEKYHLTNEQLAWYRVQYENCGEDIAYVRQENPSNAVEAFITTGNSVFNAELLALRKDEIIRKNGGGFIKKGVFTFDKEHSADGQMITMSNINWHDSKRGEILIYEEVKPGHPYVISNDPAMGGEDYFATQVFDNYTGRQVAVYHKNKCDSDEVAYQMYCLGVTYNGALITGETNTTSYLLQLIWKCGYRNMYRDQDIEDMGTRYYNKLGYKTTTKNRQTMIDMFAIAFRENPQIINDYDTICEMESFQVVQSVNGNKEKAMATGGNHDDLVMAACGFYLCRKGMRACLIEEKIEAERDCYDPLRRKNNEKRVNIGKVYQIWE